MNIYWDFEDMEEVLKTDIGFEQMRYEIAKELMKAFAANPNDMYVDADFASLARWSVEGADALIAELKKGGTLGTADGLTRWMSNSAASTPRRHPPDSHGTSG